MSVNQYYGTNVTNTIPKREYPDTPEAIAKEKAQKVDLCKSIHEKHMAMERLKKTDFIELNGQWVSKDMADKGVVVERGEWNKSQSIPSQKGLDCKWQY